MNNNILFATIATLSILGAGSFLTINRVFAQESVKRDYNPMIQMMKAYHGENWKQGCTDTMNDLDGST